MKKTDFKKEWKYLYQPSKTEFQVVEVPDMGFYKVDGYGTPGVVPEYTAAIEALYAMSYKTKFLSKKLEKDYVVPPLEGLWLAENGLQFFGFYPSGVAEIYFMMQTVKCKTVFRHPFFMQSGQNRSFVIIRSQMEDLDRQAFMIFLPAKLRQGG